MINELADRVAHFGGKNSQTRCFLHIVNLVAKSLIREFDTSKKQANELLDFGDEDLDDPSDEEIASEGMSGDADEDNADGWIDEVENLSEDERGALEESIRPVKLILVKVCVAINNSPVIMQLMPTKLRRFSFKIINSTTLLLPAWKETLKDLKLTVKYMPRDVATRWNSTFDMLHFALEYRAAIDAMTDKRKLGMGDYELDDEEWTLVEQLQNVLKVS